MTRCKFTWLTLPFASLLLVSAQDFAKAQVAAPAHSSRPGSPYTLYLDFSGFNYPGQWAGDTPGNIGAWRNAVGSFSVPQQNEIKNIWARISEAYAPFNVNVTTVDPSGLALNNWAGRLNYYDATPRVMHTIITGNSNPGSFFSGAGGVSYLDVWSGTSANGQKTNWVFGDRLSYNHRNVYTASTHENGHAAGLEHQSDVNLGNSVVNNYSTNQSSSTLAPFMGVGYGASRNTWRIGRDEGTPSTNQNDVGQILSDNPGMGYFIDSIGDTLGTATPLPLLGNLIDPSLAKGVVIPTSSANPAVTSSVAGYFSFTTTGGVNTINLHAGGQLITAGTADPEPTLDGTLRILNSGGTPVATAATSSLGETLSINLSAGNYYVEVTSAGGKAGNTNGGAWQPSQYFDIGSYFLSGTIVYIPEPSSAATLLIGVLGMLVHRRRR